MSERVWSEKDLVRRANRRLAVLQHAEEVSGSVSATCRYYGISRTVFYWWKKLYEDEGLDGLKDRSSAPMHCPNTTPPEVVAKIVHSGSTTTTGRHRDWTARLQVRVGGPRVLPDRLGFPLPGRRAAQTGPWSS